MNHTLKIVAASALFVAAGAAFAQKGETVKIAFMDPLSGPFANVGQNQLKSWQFAAEKLSGKNPRASSSRWWASTTRARRRKA